MENAYIVLGNGFSIDIIKKMKKDKEIDLNNLFRKGEYVIYPKTKQKGFLSYKNTPDLWTLGARTYMENEESMQLITDVITCANVFNLSLEKKPGEKKDGTSIFVHAYSELSSYLRYLFIYYNSLINDDELKAIVDNIELVQYIRRCKRLHKKIYVVTYNDVGV